MSEPRNVHIEFITPSGRTNSVSIHVRIGCGSYRILRVPPDSPLLLPLMELLDVPETEN
jgi:hypothetical protein